MTEPKTTAGSQANRATAQAVDDTLASTGVQAAVAYSGLDLVAAQLNALTAVNERVAAQVPQLISALQTLAERAPTSMQEFEDLAVPLIEQAVLRMEQESVVQTHLDRMSDICKEAREALADLATSARELHQELPVCAQPPARGLVRALSALEREYRLRGETLENAANLEREEDDYVEDIGPALAVHRLLVSTFTESVVRKSGPALNEWEERFWDDIVRAAADPYLRNAARQAIDQFTAEPARPDAEKGYAVQLKAEYLDAVRDLGPYMDQAPCRTAAQAERKAGAQH